jgi:glycosyltransferase involved in cell wall biosynthesis
MRACMVAYTHYEYDQRVRRYAEALVHRGDSVDVIALRSPGQSAFEVFDGVNVHRIQSRVANESWRFTYLAKLLSFFVRSMLFLAYAHARNNYDVIHVHSVPDFEVFAALVPKLTGARVILDIHDLVPEFYASKFGVSKKSVAYRMLLWTEHASALFADYVIAANDLWQKKLESRSVEKGKCMTLLNFPDRSIFQSRPRQRPVKDEFILIYPGTLNYHQGVDVAINAVDMLKDAFPNLELHIYGSGEQKDCLVRLIDDLKLADRVFMKGLVPARELVAIMAQADIGIVPKRASSFGNEAFSTKILEFMSVGIPVIASATMIDKFYFHEGVVAFFESENVQSLAACIARLIENPDLREKLVANGLDLASQYDWQTNKQKYFQLIDSLIGKDKTAAELRPERPQVSSEVGHSSPLPPRKDSL